ncbi:hypothetical protein GDO81_002739 [Engystomops pustulosus]|uniref:Uncharacterized protein n=1 Tax=Engystomops pustulosus TaxID=76066 RepID=A0AAV7DQ89_ENGPU|nr:hypothetical protein GDO81_002739 [Engystomops pustulosus]
MSARLLLRLCIGEKNTLGGRRGGPQPSQPVHNVCTCTITDEEAKHAIAEDQQISFCSKMESRMRRKRRDPSRTQFKKVI